MNLWLPFFGAIQTGKDANDFSAAEIVPPAVVTQADKEKLFDLGGILELGSKALSSEKTISHKLLEANKEWVYRNNDVIAQEVSKIEFTLFTVGLKKGEITFTEVEEHPLLDLLDKFNGSTTKADGIYITQSHKKLTGDAFWLLERNGKAITNVYILPPDKVELDLSSPNKGTAKDSGLVSAYIYKDNIDGKEIEVRYEPSQIIHFKKPNPKNPFRGYGAVEALADTIDTDNLTAHTQRKFFENGAISNFVLTTENNLTPEQLKRLRAELKAGYTGVRNAFTAMIFGNGLKPSNISMSNRDLQFLELLEWFRDKTMVCFGNTKASIGIIDDVNRASHESSINLWLSGTVKPDMNSIVNTLNEFLVPSFGDRLVLGFKDPVPDDRSDDIEEATKLKNAGIITINESREKVGYETIEGGDVFAPAGNITTPGNPADADDQQGDEEPAPENDEKRVYHRRKVKGMRIPADLAHIDVKHLLRTRKMFTERRVNREVKEASKPIIRQMLKGKKKAEVAAEDTNVSPINPQFTNEVLEGYYNKQIHIVGSIEEQFRALAERYISNIERAVLQNVPEDITTRTVKRRVQKGLLPEDEAGDLLVQAELDFTPLLTQQLALAGQEAFQLLGIDDIYNPFGLHDAVRENVRRFAGSMLDTDQDTMTKILEDGIEAGQSVYEMRKAMQEKFTELKDYQAERVTRTEVLRASNMAAEDAFIQSGVVEAKQWLIAPGADSQCIPYAGKIVKLRGSFYDSDNEFQDGNPPIHPYCRCVLIPIVIGTTSYDLSRGLDAGELAKRVAELEEKFDKRTKAYRDLKEKHTDDEVYIKLLEKHLGIGDDH